MSAQDGEQHRGAEEEVVSGSGRRPSKGAQDTVGAASSFTTPSQRTVEEEAPLSERDAQTLLARYLGATPPGPEEEELRVPRVARRLGMPENAPVVTIRTFDDRLLKKAEERAMRPTTKQEQEQGAGRVTRDTETYHTLVCVEAIVKPDLQQLCQSGKYGPRVEDVVCSWFNIGERQQIAYKLLDLMGYNPQAVASAAGKS